MALSLKERISLEGILSFIDSELEEVTDPSVKEYLEEKLRYVTEIKDTLLATSAEEDHMKATFSRVKAMHGV